MPKIIRLRTLTTEEAKEIRRLASSRTESARLVQRAKIIAALMADPDLRATHAGYRVGFKGAGSGAMWVRRFNESGLDGLQDLPRPGKPRIHDETVRSRLIGLAVQKPRTLGYSFELWTLERLQTALEERERIHLSDSTIWTWLDEEGLQWKRQESWFHDAERHDREFVAKRGR